jgi:hypothetical protein
MLTQITLDPTQWDKLARSHAREGQRLTETLRANDQREILNLRYRMLFERALRNPPYTAIIDQIKEQITDLGLPILPASFESVAVTMYVTYGLRD